MSSFPDDLGPKGALIQANELLDALGRIQADFMLSQDPRQAFERILSVILRLTKSEYGFIGELHGTAEEPYLRTYAATNIAWDDTTRRIYEEGQATGMEFRNTRTLFGSAILTGEPVIANEPGVDPRRGGLPAGHPPLRAFLGLPFRAGTQICGMVGLANRPSGYDEVLAKRLEPVLTTCGSLVAGLRARRELETTTTRLTALIRNLGAGLLVEDERRTIRLVNAELLAMFGMPGRPDDLVGADCAAAATGLAQLFEDPDAFLVGVELALAKRELSRGTEWRLRDGRTLERDYIPIFVEEAYRGHLWQYRDVSDRKRNEEALRKQSDELVRANEQLAAASRMKDEFLASMSHELRTPLVSILGLSESLSEQLHGALNERQLGAVRTIGESGHHLLDLINDVLDIAKADAAQVPLQLAECDLGAICQASLRLVKETSSRKKQRVSLAMTPAEITCYADARRLKQLLVNLLSNAVKFTPDGGQIGLEVEADEIAGTLSMVVTDTGAGIADEDRARIFEPFVQLGRSSARDAQGTGLGLTIAKKLAVLHEGGIRVEPRSGGGSRFVVELPLRRKPSPMRRESNTTQMMVRLSAVPEPRGPLVLVAEDNAASARVLSDYLEAHGYRVEVARDGAEVVAHAEASQPALVLMDIQMPGVDGREATRRIRALPDPIAARVPIIALTALAMPGDRDACLAAGADEYLTKPIVLRELIRRLGEMLPPPP